MSLYSIITGDVVSSRSFPPPLRERLFVDMDSFLKSLQGKWIRHYETYRGDSLQCQAMDKTYGLRVALMIRAFFRAYIPDTTTSGSEKKYTSKRGYFSTPFDIRLGLGIGKADFIREDKISSSDGEAFRYSGEALDKLMTASERLALISFNRDFDEQMEPAVVLVDGLIQKWTQNQAELVLYKLQDKKEDEIAAMLKISQSAVNQRSKTAQWTGVEKLVTYFEKTLKNWNHE